MKTFHELYPFEESLIHLIQDYIITAQRIDIEALRKHIASLKRLYNDEKSKKE